MASEAVTEAHDCKSFGDGYGNGARRRKGKGRGVTRQCRWEARHRRGKPHAR
ncbi:type IV secretion protein Rhs, partial [Sesbania bispinosa]